MLVSNEVRSLPLSAVSQIIERATRQGWKDTLHLAGGEPRFSPPEMVYNAITRANLPAWSKYSGFRGNGDLIDAIRMKLRLINGIEAKEDSVIVTPGGSSALFTAIRAVCDHGAEVIVQDPCWEHYLSIVGMAGAKACRFKMDRVEGRETPNLESLKASITRNTRAILLNTPLNPSGSVMSRDELLAIIEIAEKNAIWLIVDEEYEAFVYGATKHISAGSLSDRVITLQSFSKSFSLTGIRLGYAVAPPVAMDAMRKVALYTHMYPPSPSQVIATQALMVDLPAYFEGVRKHYEQKMDRLFRQIVDIPGIECDRPQGGVYLFPLLPMERDRPAD